MLRIPFVATWSLLLVLQIVIDCEMWRKLTNAEYREMSRGEDGLFRGVSPFSRLREVVVKYWGRLKGFFFRKWGRGRGRGEGMEGRFEGKCTGARFEEKGAAGSFEEKGFRSLEGMLREEEGV